MPRSRCPENSTPKERSDPMEACCLLLICCPPEARKQRAVQYYVNRGLDTVAAEIAAEGMLAIVDQLMTTSLGELMKHLHKG